MQRVLCIVCVWHFSHILQNAHKRPKFYAIPQSGSMCHLWVESATNRKFDKNNLYVLRMETIEIKVSEYYNQPKYFAYMPEAVFNALEEAFVAGKETAIVPKVAFETMLSEFNNN